MTFTWRKLATEIAQMTEEQKDTDVTVFVSGIDEYYGPLEDAVSFSAEDNDVLDVGHPHIRI